MTKENLTMMIKDLEMSKELDREALSEVRGGSNFSYNGGQYAPQTIGGGAGFFSPVTAVNSPVNSPIAVQNDNDTYLDLDLKTANVVASALTGVIQ
jgi:hypothetical protein